MAAIPPLEVQASKITTSDEKPSANSLQDTITTIDVPEVECFNNQDSLDEQAARLIEDNSHFGGDHSDSKDGEEPGVSSRSQRPLEISTENISDVDKNAAEERNYCEEIDSGLSEHICLSPHQHRKVNFSSLFYGWTDRAIFQALQLIHNFHESFKAFKRLRQKRNPLADGNLSSDSNNVRLLKLPFLSSDEVGGAILLTTFLASTILATVLFVTTKSSPHVLQTEDGQDLSDSPPSPANGTDIMANLTAGTATAAANDEEATILYGTGEDEPNPPVFPDSVKLFYPPQNEEEIQALRADLLEFSDPILKWEDFSDNMPPPRSKPNFPSFTYTSDNHFSPKRNALLFTPGKYPNLDFEVGYYTSVLGLGVHPTDVKFTGCSHGPHVPALDKFTDRPPSGSGLNTFWRSIENIATDASEGMQWVVSQAAPLRRVHVQTDLDFFDGDAWVSGGVAANVVVDGKVNFGGQQQWLMRNVNLAGGIDGGAWSLVFVGCTGMVPGETSGISNDMGSGSGQGPSITVENSPKLRVEKPYIALKQGLNIKPTERRSKVKPQSDLHAKAGISNDKVGDKNNSEFELRVPTAARGKTASGPNFDAKHDEVRDFRRVKLGIPSASVNSLHAATENYNVLQLALDEGKDLVLSPGIYPLLASLEVKYPNQVILGLGYATLVAPADGSPCIYVRPRVPGVRIAGVMLEATVLSEVSREHSGQTSTLLRWGDPNVADEGDKSNPGVLSDVYARVGGASFNRHVSTDVMIELNSGNIYGDNLWLWRADHVQLRQGEKPNFPHISPLFRQTVMGECMVKNGLVVNGADVTIVGLAVEHTVEDQTIWNGENGNLYFYQCEFPYDVDQTFAENSFAGYRVGNSTQNHKASGLGVYSNFRDFDIDISTAVVHPVHAPPSSSENSPKSRSSDIGIHMRNIFTVKLDNQGRIKTVINNRGPGPLLDSERGRPFRCWDETCVKGRRISET